MDLLAVLCISLQSHLCALSLNFRISVLWSWIFIYVLLSSQKIDI